MFARCDVTSSADCAATVRGRRPADLRRSRHPVQQRRASSAAPTWSRPREDEWARVMAVNVTSVFLMSKHAIPVMAAGGRRRDRQHGLRAGASRAATRRPATAPPRAPSSTSRGRWRSTTAPRGIRANCVCPGDTDTGMLREEARQLGEPEAAFLGGCRRPAAGADQAPPEDIASRDAVPGHRGVGLGDRHDARGRRRRAGLRACSRLRVVRRMPVRLPFAQKADGQSW